MKGKPFYSNKTQGGLRGEKGRDATQRKKERMSIWRGE